jgi:hypothetical protein
MAFIKEQQDIKTCGATVEALKSVLFEMPLLALETEPSDCIQPFQDFLLSLTENISIQSQFEKSGRDWISLRKNALEASILMALETGSVAELLEILQRLYSFASDPKRGLGNVKLQLSSHLKQFKEWQIPLILSPMVKESFIMNWGILWNEFDRSLNTKSASQNKNSTSPASYISTSSNLSTLASDGTLLLISLND